MKDRTILIFMRMGILAQFTVLAWMMVKREITLNAGVTCLLRTAPVDPSDPFRGRYVALGFADFRNFERDGTNQLRRGDRVWVVLQTNELGEARIKDVVEKYPTGLCMEARVAYTVAPHLPLKPINTNATDMAEAKPPAKTLIHFQGLPCDRYYMPEKLAPQTEQIYLSALRGSGVVAHAQVRIWRGNVFLQDLLVDGKPIRQLLVDTLK